MFTLLLLISSEGFEQNLQYIPVGYGTIPPVVSVVSPEPNKTYNASDVSLGFTVNRQAPEVSYSLDGHDNVTVTGIVTFYGLSSGIHTITVYATDSFNNTGASETISFSIAEEPEQPESDSGSPLPVEYIYAGAIIAIILSLMAVLFLPKKHKKTVDSISSISK